MRCVCVRVCVLCVLACACVFVCTRARVCVLCVRVLACVHGPTMHAQAQASDGQEEVRRPKRNVAMPRRWLRVKPVWGACGTICKHAHKRAHMTRITGAPLTTPGRLGGGLVDETLQRLQSLLGLDGLARRCSEAHVTRGRVGFQRTC